MSKRAIIILTIVLVVAVGLFAFFNLRDVDKVDRTLGEFSSVETFVAFMSEDGELVLYNLADEKVAELDLKNYIDPSFKRRIVTISPSKPDVRDYNPELIEGRFVKVDIAVPKGEFVWVIQRRLTPDENIARLVNQYLRNFNEKLHVIQPGTVITFLKYYEDKEITEEVKEEVVIESDYLFRFYKEEDILYAIEFATGTKFVIDPFNLVILKQNQVNAPLLDSFIVDSGRIIGAKDGVLYINNEIFKTFEVPILDWEFLDDKFYVTTGSEHIYVVNKEKEVKLITPREKTVLLTQKGGFIYALNNFGQGLEKNILLEIKDGSVLGWYELADESYIVKNNPLMVIRENVLHIHSLHRYTSRAEGIVLNEILDRDAKYQGGKLFSYDNNNIYVINIRGRQNEPIILNNRLQFFEIFQREAPPK